MGEDIPGGKKAAAEPVVTTLEEHVWITGGGKYAAIKALTEGETRVPSAVSLLGREIRFCDPPKGR